MESFWGDIREYAAAVETPPVAILRSQAIALSDQTDGYLRGVVRTSSDGGTMTHELVAIAPALEDVGVTLITVRHPTTTFYPARWISVVHRTRTGESATPEAFMADLRQLLHDTPDVTMSLANLLAQSRQVA